MLSINSNYMSQASICTLFTNIRTKVDYEQLTFSCNNNRFGRVFERVFWHVRIHSNIICKIKYFLRP